MLNYRKGQMAKKAKRPNQPRTLNAHQLIQLLLQGNRLLSQVCLEDGFAVTGAYTSGPLQLSLVFNRGVEGMSGKTLKERLEGVSGSTKIYLMDKSLVTGMDAEGRLLSVRLEQPAPAA